MDPLTKLSMWNSGGNTTESTYFFRTPRSEPVNLHDLQSQRQVALRMQATEGVYQGEFRVSVPGNYLLESGTESIAFQVSEYKKFSVQSELLATGSAVALFFAIFVYQLKKRRGRYEN